MITRLLLLLGSLALFSTPAHAVRLCRGDCVEGQLRAAQGFAETAQAGAFRADSDTPYLHGWIRGLGRYDLMLSRRKAKDWEASFVSNGATQSDPASLSLLRGTLWRRVAGKRLVTPLAGAYVMRSGGRKLDLIFSAPEISGDRTNFYRVTLRLNKDGAILSQRARRTPDLLLANHNCAADHMAVGNSGGFISAESVSSPGSAAAGALRQIDFATEADFEFYTRFGADTNTEMATLVNAADVIYQRDLGLTFKITGQRTQTSGSQPVTATDPEALLTQFSDYIAASPPSADHDLSHLFTGKDMNGSTVGIAWVGVVCYSTYYSTGSTQFLSDSLNYVILAHEVGHNFNASHDTATLPSTIMYPSVPVSVIQFSATSINQITSFVAAHSSCLADVSATPTPTPTSTPAATVTPGGPPTAVPTATPTASAPTGGSPGIDPTVAPTPTYNYKVTSKRSRPLNGTVVVQGILESNPGVRINQAVLYLVRGNKVLQRKRTNADGIARFSVTKSGNYYLAYQTPDEAIVTTKNFKITF